MRRMNARFEMRTCDRVWRVTSRSELANDWDDAINVLLNSGDEDDLKFVAKAQAQGLKNVDWIVCAGLETGDVIRPLAGRNEVVVLYRESDSHHSFQLTNRCNSNCLMCSQPPTAEPDGWMVSEAVQAIEHMRRPPNVLGLSGGEPLLIGSDLERVFDAVNRRAPDTVIELLTNGRLLADRETMSRLVRTCGTPVTWLVPLYGHADFLHDYVVQSPGAFEQTLAGLLNLHEHGQAIQLRIVLIEPVLEILPDLATFIGRNLPFVREVALMACEPIGFALANRDICAVDLLEWSSTLEECAQRLKDHRVPFLFMNTPLCAVPRHLRRHAHRSISDWKNVYPSECDSCSLKPECSGLFAWHERGWMPVAQLQKPEERVA